MKKFLTFLLVLVMLAIAVPTFAALKEVTCPVCYGSGWGSCPRFEVAFNYKRNDKGKKVRVPPYQKRCHICGGSGKKRCTNCNGTGKRRIYIPDAR